MAETDGDLSVTIPGFESGEAVRLNIRVTVLLEIQNGWIFERDKNGFYFPVGGRIKVLEDSRAAAIRETDEELGQQFSEDSLTFAGIFENFFRYDGEAFHEINFVYRAELPEGVTLPVLPDRFYAFPIEEIPDLDVRPEEVKQIITGDWEYGGRLVVRHSSIL